MFVRLNDKLDLLYEMVCQSEDNELNQDNIRTFVKSTQGTKEQQNIAANKKEKDIVTPQDNLTEVNYEAELMTRGQWQ